MSVPLQRVQDILDVLKSNNNVFTDSNIPVNYCVVGTIQAGLALNKSFDVIDVDTGNVDEDGNPILEKVIDSDISSQEIYLAGLYAYRNYALQEHDEMRRKAINFKTISFSVTGLTERAKETMRIVWWCDEEITNVLNQLRKPIGNSSNMVGDKYGQRY